MQIKNPGKGADHSLFIDNVERRCNSNINQQNMTKTSKNEQMNHKHKQSKIHVKCI